MSIHEQVAALSYNEKLVLYVMGMIDEMKGLGLVEGGRYTVSEKGDQYLAALRESGFKPTAEEIEETMGHIIADSKRTDAELEDDFNG